MIKRLIVIVSSIAIVLTLVLFAEALSNRHSAHFQQLPDAEQQLIADFAAYKNSNELWAENLARQHPTLVLNGPFKHAYYFPSEGQEINSIHAVAVDDTPVRVYRLSRLAPSAWRAELHPGNFPTIGKRFELFDHASYYINPGDNDFLPYYAHESFHYFMQNLWPKAECFEAELSPQDLDLAFAYYELLAPLREVDSLSKPELETIAHDYVALMDKRIASNPEWMRQEMELELVEGSAQYVQYKAAELVGRPQGIEDIGNIPVLWEAGAIDSAFLANRAPYETGAALSYLLDGLEVAQWQERLNRQHYSEPVFFYDLLSNMHEY